MSSHSPHSSSPAAPVMVSATEQPSAAHLPPSNVFPTHTSGAGRLRHRVTRVRTFVRQHPFLCALAILLFGSVLIVKVLAFRAAALDREAALWFTRRGGGIWSHPNRGHVVIGILSEIFLKKNLEGRLVSNVTIPSSMVRNESPTMYEKLAQFQGLRSINFSDETYMRQQQFILPDAATPKAKEAPPVIDSTRLQQIISMQSETIHLGITGHVLAPVETPLELSNRLFEISLNKVHITRDFARGLPYARSLRYLAINNATIEDDAVDILLERLSGNKGQIANCEMSESTYDKLRMTPGITVGAHWAIGSSGPAANTNGHAETIAAPPLKTAPANSR